MTIITSVLILPVSSEQPQTTAFQTMILCHTVYLELKTGITVQYQEKKKKKKAIEFYLSYSFLHT